LKRLLTRIIICDVICFNLKEDKVKTPFSQYIWSSEKKPLTRFSLYVVIPNTNYKEQRMEAPRVLNLPLTETHTAFPKRSKNSEKKEDGYV
jgi:hypothetical protein